MRRGIWALVVFFIISAIIIVWSSYKPFEKDMGKEIISDISGTTNDADSSQSSRMPGNLSQVRHPDKTPNKPEAPTNANMQPSTETQKQDKELYETVNPDKVGTDEVEAEKLRRQRERYEQLAVLLPRHFELSELYGELQKRRPKHPGDGASKEEIQSWREEEEAFQKEEATLSREMLELDKTLAALFPEAVEMGLNYFSIDFRKLRGLVGGRLPIDK